MMAAEYRFNDWFMISGLQLGTLAKVPEERAKELVDLIVNNNRICADPFDRKGQITPLEGLGYLMAGYELKMENGATIRLSNDDRALIEYNKDGQWLPGYIQIEYLRYIVGVV